MSHVVVNAARPETREQRAWYWYDWANSAYVTTTAHGALRPLPHDRRRAGRLPGLRRRPRTATTNLLRARHPRRRRVAVVLHRDLHHDPLRDRPAPSSARSSTASARKTAAAGRLRLGRVLRRGAACSSSRGDRLAARRALVVVASICLGGCSLVIYDAILVDIATENERDRVSSRGWAFGYLGGGLLLALNLVLVLVPRRPSGSSRALSVRHQPAVRRRCGGPASRSSRYLRAARPAGTSTSSRERSAGVVGGSFGAAAHARCATCARYPQTLLFLLAYLFFNDGIQTVIGASSVYGAKELGFCPDGS